MPNIYDDHIYKEVLDAQVIKEAQKQLTGLFFYELEKLKANQFLLTADEAGIGEAEALFNIIPDLKAESLELRRQRVINRNTTKPPYTYRYLKIKLDEIFGVGNYAMRRDLKNRTLYVESSVESSMWYTEVSVTVGKLKPANLVYINNPYIRRGLNISEGISYGHWLYNYKLGTRWRLGRKPFAEYEEEDNVKMLEIKSIKDELLHAVANFSVEEVVAVRLNNTLVIRDISRTTEGNEGTLQYGITKEELAEVSKIELLNAADEVLAASDVYIPVADPVQVKHRFTVKEGL